MSKDFFFSVDKQTMNIEMESFFYQENNENFVSATQSGLLKGPRKVKRNNEKTGPTLWRELIKAKSFSSLVFVENTKEACSVVCLFFFCSLSNKLPNGIDARDITVNSNSRLSFDFA